LRANVTVKGNKVMSKGVKSARRASGRGIIITNYDWARLQSVLRRASADEQCPTSSLMALAGELGRAKVVPRAEIPPDVVAMGSTVRLRDLETGEDETYTLVYPEQADIRENTISVLAPVGTALLGYRAGDTVEWPVPSGIRRFRIEEVLSQPKAVLAGGIP
jgi:regulator of nucleoside diphosphate kinase